MKNTTLIFYSFIILLLLFPASPTEGYSVEYRENTTQTQVERPAVDTKKKKKSKKKHLKKKRRRKKKNKRDTKFLDFEWNALNIIAIILFVFSTMALVAVWVIGITMPGSLSIALVVTLIIVNILLEILAGIFLYFGSQDEQTKRNRREKREKRKADRKNPPPITRHAYEYKMNKMKNALTVGWLAFGAVLLGLLMLLIYMLTFNSVLLLVLVLYVIFIGATALPLAIYFLIKGAIMKGELARAEIIQED